MSLDPQPATTSTGTPPPAVDPVAKVRALARPVAELRRALLARIEATGSSGEGSRLVADAFDFAIQAHGEQLREIGRAHV